jgi:hypothetical protein
MIATYNLTEVPEEVLLQEEKRLREKLLPVASFVAGK